MTETNSTEITKKDRLPWIGQLYSEEERLDVQQ